MKKKLNNKKTSNSFFFNCPACNKKGFSVEQRIDTIPYLGEVLETFAKCKYCKYKTHDILPLTEKDYPKKHKIKISKQKDLERRVIKGKYCTIKVPEIELEIDPGPGSESYISNLEGVIDRIIYSLKRIKKLKKEEKKIDKKIKLLESAKNQKKEITIIFEDPTRQSVVLKNFK